MDILEYKSIPIRKMSTSSGQVIQFNCDTLEFTLPEPEKVAPFPTAFRIALTEGCNLGCPACFVRNSSLRTLSQSELDGLVERSLRLAMGKAPLYHFFGGEPLLEFSLLKRAVGKIKAAHKKGEILKPVFAITTNGTILDQDIMTFLKRNNFRVGVSVDGPRKIHDVARPFINGKGTYDLVSINYREMRSCGLDTHVLITPNSDTLGNLPKVVEHILTEFEMKHLTINTPYLPDTLGWSLDGERFARSLVEVWRIGAERGVAIDCALTPVLAAISNQLPRRTPCSITGESFMASAGPGSRDFSFCAQRWFTSLAFDSTLPEGPKKCQVCPARKYCGGTCPAFRILSGKDYDAEKCAFMNAVLPLIVENLDLFAEGGE